MNAFIWGVCLIFVGIGLVGKFTGLFGILFGGWWTLGIIAPALIDFFTKKNKFFSLCLLALGIDLLLQQLGLIHLDVFWKVLLAFLIVVVGISLLLPKNKKINDYMNIKGCTNDFGNYNAILCGQKTHYDNEKFLGATLRTILGGIVLDLSKAIIEKNVVIDVCVVLGGCEIHVPSGVNVRTSGSNILGGVDNKISSQNLDAVTILVRANVLLGGLEIK